MDRKWVFMKKWSSSPQISANDWWEPACLNLIARKLIFEDQRRQHPITYFSGRVRCCTFDLEKAGKRCRLHQNCVPASTNQTKDFLICRKEDGSSLFSLECFQIRPHLCQPTLLIALFESSIFHRSGVSRRIWSFWWEPWWEGLPQQESCGPWLEAKIQTNIKINHPIYTIISRN